MPYINYVKSFIASVECHTEDFQGFLDCAELSEGANGVERTLGDWVTVHDFPQEAPHLFRFDCYYEGDDYCGYYIQSYSKSQGRGWNSTGLRFDFDASGYVKTYPLKQASTRYWQPKLWENGVERDVIEDLHEGVMTNVRLRSPDGYTLKGWTRKHVGEHFFAYTNDADGPTLEMSLHIHRLEFEDLDDH